MESRKPKAPWSCGMCQLHWSWDLSRRRFTAIKDLIQPLQQAFTNIIDRGLVAELKTWDGCFNIRKKVGSATPSLHSWGVAIDINAAWNGFNKPPTMSSGLVACFKDAGFDWGGEWSKPDGMHFQLGVIRGES